MLMTFWAPVHGQCGNSTLAAATACQLAVSHKMKMLLTHTNYSHRALEYLFFQRRELSGGHMLDTNDNGLDAIARLANNKRLIPDGIGNYTQAIIPNMRLDFLVGTRQQDEGIFESKAEDVQNALDIATEKYDLVMVDLNNGFDSTMSRTLIQRSDLAIVVLNQNQHVLDYFLEHPLADEVLGKSHVVFVVNRVSEEVRLTPQNMRRRLGGAKIVEVPDYIKVQDIANRSEMLDFILRNQQVGKNQPEDGFVQGLKVLSERIVDAMKQIQTEKG